jgi:hypothetical protein
MDCRVKLGNDKKTLGDLRALRHPHGAHHEGRDMVAHAASLLRALIPILSPVLAAAALLAFTLLVPIAAAIPALIIPRPSLAWLGVPGLGRPAIAV